MNNTGNPTRIVNGSTEKEGRVEVFWNYQWSTICDNGWDDNDAVVLCKQLGYSGGSARGSAYFGEGTGLLRFNNFNCSGTEQNIYGCIHNHDVGYCSHQRDAGVVCTGEPFKGNI